MWPGGRQMMLEAGVREGNSCLEMFFSSRNTATLCAFLTPGIKMQFQPPLSKFHLAYSISWPVDFLGIWQGYVGSWTPTARVVLVQFLLALSTWKPGRRNPCLAEKGGGDCMTCRLPCRQVVWWPGNPPHCWEVKSLEYKHEGEGQKS